ncbi:MAG: hypothetical protein AMXMBFR64_37190 [Myxococcales bacterium]
MNRTSLLLLTLGMALGCKGQEAAPTSPPTPAAATPGVAQDAPLAKTPPEAAPDSPPTSPDAAPTGRTRIAVIHTANRVGEINDCGCRAKPLGGIARHKGWIGQNASQWEAALLLDAGNTLTASTEIGETFREREQDRAEAIVDAYGLMGLDAQGVAEKDLAIGLDRLRELAKRAKFPFLSANLLDAGGQPVFPGHTVITKAGHRIGVVSVLSPHFLDAERLTAAWGVRVSDPTEAVRREVETLRKDGVRIIVALAMLPLTDAEALARAVPELTAILGTSDMREQTYPVTVGHTYVCDSWEKGKRFSVLTLHVAPGDEELVFTDPGRRAALQQQVADLDTRIAEREKAIEAATQDPGAARNLDWLKQNVAKLKAERQTLTLDLADLGEVDASRSNISYDFPEVTQDLPADGPVDARLDALRAKYPELKGPGE